MASITRPEYQSEKSKFTVWDAGSFTNIVSQRVYLGTSIAKADSEDNDFLLKNAGIKTLVDTAGNSDSMGWQPMANAPRVHVPKPVSITKTLGINHVQTNLQAGDELAKQRFWEMTWIDKTRIAFGALSGASTSDPSLTAMMDGYKWKPSSVEYSFKILTGFAKEIGTVFNKVLASETSYPLLLTGGVLMGESCLFLLLLAMLVDSPSGSLDDWHTHMIDTSGIKIGTPSQTPANARHLQSWVDQRAIWATSVEKLVLDKYGSIGQYLLGAGVDSVTQDAIKNILHGVPNVTKA